MSAAATPRGRESPLDRALRLFTDVRAGESGSVLLLAFNVFLILAAYYLVRVIREPLLFRDYGADAGARFASYSSAGQAIVLLFLVPLYGALARRMPRRRLINIVTAFFVLCLGAFWMLARLGVRISVPFYIWVGVFSLMIIAQFWSFATDLYTTDEGKRLFPVIAFGGSIGAVSGAWMSGRLQGALGLYQILLAAAAVLVVAVVITNIIDARERRRTEASVPDAMTSGTMPAATPQLRAATGEFKAVGEDYRRASGTLKAISKQDLERLGSGAAPEPVPSRGGAFGLVMANRYLLLVGLMMLVLNWVNTNGGYILNKTIASAAAAAEAAGRDPDAVAVAFYSGYLTTINLVGLFLQLFVVSRVLKYFGVRISLLVLPLIALGGYTLMAFAPILAAVRWAKTAENATDYSLQNTLRSVLFLPTTREEKYAAKQVIDAFVPRMGDLLSAGLVWFSTSLLLLSTRQFALINVALVVAWLLLAGIVGRRYERLSALTV